jgi:iron complex transport system substrate-binding protein
MRISISFSRLLFLLLICFSALTGCQKKAEQTVANSTEKEPAQNSGKITVTDDLGRKLEIPAQPKRVMALAASMTEMLYAVVPDSMIVGRTQVCNYPPQALKKPVINSFPVDLESLLKQKPEIVFTEDGITSLEIAAKIQEMGIPVYFQKYQKVEDVFDGLNDIGRIMHFENRAKHLTDSLKAELNAIQNAPKSKTTLRALALISSDPIYVFGQNTLMTDKIKLAGGENALTEVFKQQSPPLTREYILQLDPDVIFGLNAERKQTFFNLYPELKRIKAYQQNRIYDLTDDLASRPSPRVVESIKEIKAYLLK